MKKSICHIICIFVAILATGCAGDVSDQNGYAAYSEEITAALCDGDAERALAIVDSVEAASGIDHFNAELLRCKVFSDDETTVDTARIILERLIRQEHLAAEQQAAVLEQLVYVARLRQYDESILKYGTQYIEVCRQLGKETKALETQSIISSALVHMGRTDEGLTKMDDAIAQLDRVHGFSEMDACIRAIKSKIRTLIYLERYEEIIPMGERILEKLNDYGEHPDVYVDDSERMPTDERRPGYIDFYRGQAYAFLAYAYAMDHQTAKAQESLRSFEQTAYSKTFDGKKVISATWCELGMYDKMLAFYDEKDRAWGADTLHRDYAISLYNRATAARARGQYQLSDSYMKRHAALQKYLGNSERMAAAQEYAARYHEQEQQLELEREHTVRRNVGTIATFLGLIALALTVFVVILMRQRRDIRHKNHVLVEQISEVMKYKNMAEHGGQIIGNQADNPIPSAVPTDPSKMSDEELYGFLCEAIRRERLFINPTFGRQTLADRYHLSDRRIGAAFSHGNGLPAFVAEQRLELACQLLAGCPDMSIGDVAAACGFSNPSVFSRDFKAKYAVTPTGYRKG